MLKILKKRYVAVLPIFAILLIVAMTGMSTADKEANSSEYTLSVTGSGTVKATPNQAVISLGVITQADTVSDAVLENAEKMNAAVAALRQLGISEDDIETSWYSVNPIYEWNEMKHSSTITGYEVTNTITVTTYNLDILGPIIDNATAAGVNRVNSLTFKVSDEMQSQLEEIAIQNACADAKVKAEIIAESLNVTVIGVKSISVNSVWPITPIYSALDVRAVESTSIFPGESEITATVHVEFLIQNF